MRFFLRALSIRNLASGLRLTSVVIPVFTYLLLLSFRAGVVGKLTMTRGRQVLLWLLATSAVTRAVKDSSWHNGIESPNVDLPMYWDDMPNILEDLGNFTRLHVQFHSCAWTQLGGYGDQEDTGKDVEENDYWYMGAMNSGVGWSYAPQVAFSLYGTLKGSRRKGCGKATYINSFYTTSGYYAFSNEIANAGIANNGNKFNMYCQSGVGMSCSSTGNGFSFTQYSDSYCTRGKELSEGVSDELMEFNNVLNEAKCVEIYDSSTGNLPYLLFHSRSCQLHDEVGACPDPHGRKSLYERRLSRALAGLAPDDEKFHQQMVKGYTLLGVGGLFVSMALILAVYEKFYGPRRLVTTKTIDNDKDKVDIEALGEQKSRRTDGKAVSKELSDTYPPIHEAPTDERGYVGDLSAAKSASFEQLDATQSMSFEPAMFKCGEPTLDSVLDQVEDAVAGTNLECTSEENIMACVQVALDGKGEIECTAVPDDDVSITAEPKAAESPVSGDKKGFPAIPAIQSALSLISKASTDANASPNKKEKKRKEAKKKAEAAIGVADGTAGSQVTATASSPASPKTTDAIKNKFKFWK